MRWQWEEQTGLITKIRLRCQSRQTALLSASVRRPQARNNTKWVQWHLQVSPWVTNTPRWPWTGVDTSSCQEPAPRECFHSVGIRHISKCLRNENSKVTQHSSVMSCCPIPGTNPETINPRAKEEQRTPPAFVPEHYYPISRLEPALAQEKNIN